MNDDGSRMLFAAKVLSGENKRAESGWGRLSGMG